MDQALSAFSEFLGSVTEQVGRLRNVRDDLLYIADDTVRAVLNSQKLYSPWQQEYSKVFRAWLQDSRGEGMKINQAVNDLQSKDVTIASNASGGFGVPKQLAATIDSFARPVCPLLDPDILGAVEVNTGDYHQPIGSAESSAARTTETGARSATGTATFADRVPSFGTYYAYVTVSQHAKEDIGDRLEAFLADEFAAQVGAQLMSDIVSGTGSGQVLGLTHTTPVTTPDFSSPMRSMDACQYQPMAGATVVLGDLENLLSLYNEQYLTADDFTFIMRPSTWFKLWGVGRSGTGSVEAPFRMPKFMPTLYGQRVALTGNAPAASSNQFPILAGSWKRGYLLVTRGPAMLTVDEVTVPGQVKYHYRIRYGGAIRAGNALKLLKWATS